VKEKLKNYDFIISIVVFIVILLTHIEFYKAVVFLLEFMVILEVVKMITDFISQNKLSLRYIIDVFIIFLIRDVVINVTGKNYDKDKITFLLIIIGTFFIFRILTIIFSPTLYKKLK